MKKIIFCLMIMLSVGATTKLFAQNNNSQQRQQAMRAFLKDSVNLSDAMTDSVMAIRTQFTPQMRDIYSDQSSSNEDKMTKLQSMRAAMEARYKAAGITDEQIQKMHDHEDRMRAQMRNGMNNGGQ